MPTGLPVRPMPAMTESGTAVGDGFGQRGADEVADCFDELHECQREFYRLS
jgi:hypothetical protein